MIPPSDEVYRVQLPGRPLRIFSTRWRALGYLLGLVP